MVLEGDANLSVNGKKIILYNLCSRIGFLIGSRIGSVIESRTGSRIVIVVLKLSVMLFWSVFGFHYVTAQI